MTEDQILTQIAVEQALALLSPADAMMMRLIHRLEVPEDWGNRAWPAKYEAIGNFIGIKYEGAPLSEATIRYRRDAIYAMWAGKRGPLRRNRR